MKKRLQSLAVGLWLMLGLLGCVRSTSPVANPPPEAKTMGPAGQQQQGVNEVAGLPDVLGHKEGGHGPAIAIWANGDLYLDTTLRDNEVVSAEQLGNYLARIQFKSTRKVAIRADEADARKAQLTAKFELTVAVNRKDSGRPSAPVMRMSFNEMRLMRSASTPDAWVLTPDGIELIEKAIPQK
jgi:hypothetical protein